MALQMPNDALLGVAIQQGAGATDYIKMTTGYELAVSDNDDFSFYPFTDLSLAPVKNVDVLPPEIGGKALPTGQFVTGIWGEGPVSLIPRLDNRLGWLLLASMGQVSTVPNQKAADLSLIGGDGSSTSGVNTHIFSVVQDNQFFIPWITARRKLPHVTAAEEVGEVFQDGRVAAMTLTAAAASPVTMDLNVMARVKQSNYVFNPNPATWTAVYDDFDNFAVTSCDGFVRIADVDFDVTAVTVNLVNQLMPPAQTLTIGSVHPTDFPNLGRVMTVTVTYLVDNYDMYVSSLAGSTVDVSGSSGENVACTIYEAEFDVMLASQTAIGAAGDATEPYRLRLISNQLDDNVSWMVRPLRIQPNRPIVCQLTGTFLASPSGYPWYMFLQNSQANYSLPT
ncbi:MAG: phage tail tube protein [Planctomycetota bacterium]|jgi:hypothetical protein